MTESLETDVAIVGAGLAGLVAARRLVAAGKEALVLEARERVGGRLLNEEIGDGKVVEVGGQWIGPTQERLAALAAELDVGTFPTYDEGRHLIEMAGKRTSYGGALTDARVGLVRELSRAISPLALADLEQARARLDRMAREVPLEQPWMAPRAADWDSQTFATWVERNTRTEGAQRLFELATEAVWAAEPGDVSLLHVLFYTHSGGGFNTLVGTGGGAQQDRFEGGSQRIALLMAEQLGARRLRLGAPVRGIEHGGSGVVLHADGPCGEAGALSVRAQRAIVAIPPTLAGRVAYDPPLPARRDQLTQRMPQGTVIKTMAIYTRPFWREEGFSGQATSDAGPARVVFDNSPPDGSPGVLLGFLEGRLARQWGARDAAERREAILAGHARLFGPRAAQPERFIERVWAEEEWTRGCYGCLMTTGGWTEYGRALRAPIGPLHWAGAETATVWNGYMDGAVQSGERAAAEALAALGS
jgi:monoamine oxidase